MSSTPLRRRPALSPWPVAAALVLLWAALLWMVETHRGLAAGDRSTLHWLVGHRSGALTSLFEALSSTPVDGAASLVGAGLVGLVALRSRSWRPLLTFGAVVAGAVVLAELLKALVGRARPPVATMLGTPESGSGFPSAHTLVLTAVAGGVALVVYRTGPSRTVRVVTVGAAVLASLAMGASRLYLGDHWLTDVLASYLLAGVLLAAVAALSRPHAGRTQADQVVFGGLL